MCDGSKHCEDCGSFIPLTKRDAMTVCNSLPHFGAWQRWRAQIIKQVAYALKCHGICAYMAEIVDGIGVPCDEGFWDDK